MYDENNDGVVDFTEFMVMYYIMADGSPEEVLIKIFRIFDVNSDGVISTHEMRKLITDMYGMLKKEVHIKIRFLFCRYWISIDTPILSTQKYLSPCLRQVTRHETCKFLLTFPNLLSPAVQCQVSCQAGQP